ncbi:MAG: hypothetical protein ACYCV7_04190 [Acidimicrobiales bacterium]
MGLASVLCATATLGPWRWAGADTPAPPTTLIGYNASAQSVGARFTFNVPGVVPLPNENLLEEDVPFSRVDVGSGPVVDSLSAPYYPGDVAANMGSLLSAFGAPPGVPNDTLLANARYPTSPGFPAHAAFGGNPPAGSPLAPSVFSAVSNAGAGGGNAVSTVSNLALDPMGKTPPLGLPPGPPGSAGVLDVGNFNASNAVTVGPASMTATSSSQVRALDIAGMVDVSALTASAGVTSDGTTATPSAVLRLGQVTVDGTAAYINGTGVHIAGTRRGSAAGSPAVLQKTLDATLAQDGITIRTLDPRLTTNGAEGTANAGGLSVTLSHQLDVPFIPGEPTIPVPGLGNFGLPAGLYTVTTSVIFGMARAGVSASALAPAAAPNSTTGGSAGPSGIGTATTAGTSSPGDASSIGLAPLGGVSGSERSLPATGPGSGQVPVASSPSPSSTAADFPIRGIPAPLGWAVAALLACLLCAYPLLLLARWQFLAGRR